MKSIKKKIIKALCLLVFVMVSNSISLTQLKAQGAHQTNAGEKEDIRCVSAESDMLIFELNLQNLPVKGSRLQITDEAGNLIFEKYITTATFNVRYKIERNSMSKLVFEISGKKLHLNKSFTISSRTEEKIEVAKL